MPPARRAPRARTPTQGQTEGGLRTQRLATSGGHTALAPGIVAASTPIAGAVALTGAGVLTAAVIASQTRAVLANLRRFSVVRATALLPYVEDAYRETRPRATREEVTANARHEVAREEEFRRRQQLRVGRELPKALAIADPKARLQRVDAILKRERDHSSAREEAVAARAAGRADAVNVRELEPDGPYWVLGHRATHTPDCVAMAGKAWPWAVLVEFAMIPPVHTGCGCRLLTRTEAVLEGYEDTLPPVVGPLALARQRVAAAIALHPHDHGPLLEAVAVVLGAARA